MISDHSPVSMSLVTTTQQTRKAINWRLNPSLLTDPEIHHRITEELLHFFTSNSSKEVATLSIWEDHKCTLRGEFIKWRAKRKCKRELEIAKFVDKIAALEMQHKQS